MMLLISYTKPLVLQLLHFEENDKFKIIKVDYFKLNYIYNYITDNKKITNKNNELEQTFNILLKLFQSIDKLLFFNAMLSSSTL